MTSQETKAPPAPFPRPFWTANTTELFERAAYYSMASFVVIYLGRLGLGDYWPSTLNGFLWFIVYFLPILSGTIADAIGFRRALLAACVILAGGYFLMGYPVWFGGATFAATVSDKVTAGNEVFVPIMGAILLIGIGASIVKPTISGTVQKTHMGRATLAFAIFYMVVNIGSVTGRIVAFWVRSAWSNLSLIFLVAMCCSIVAFFVVLFFYRDPESPADVAAKPRRSVGQILLDIVFVLKDVRFVLFLIVSSGFWFIYSQVYNVLPLYVKRVVETNPPMDLYTAANAITIVCFQLLVTRKFGKLKPIRSIVVGTVIIGAAMLINLVPVWSTGGVRALSPLWLPMGSLFVVMTVALIAFGEIFTSSRMFEWVGALAPKGKEGLFLGYANLPTAIGSLVGGPVGALIFNKVMCKNATKLPDGLLQLDPAAATSGWLILMAIGLVSAAGMWLFNRWLERQPVTV
jgi:dipeptide/tripeptide permease